MPISPIISSNVFNYRWSKVKLYTHPPILILDRVLQKMKQDKSQGIIIAQIWPGQSWYTKLKNLTIKFLFLGLSERIQEIRQKMKDKDQKYPPDNVDAFRLDLLQMYEETFYRDRTEDSRSINIFNTTLSNNRTCKARYP
ncbi:MAG: hypothetical protein EZS28_013900 [Streblomastix strix]|uniref:Uncharacterized protein n=1 Tax=Streblomastix strix TaxID=222440 RepID=A0A5J4W763_9EUKA|nr:MAG: hypothetical protein EZS28_013900 [Streblomastix strix]